MNARDWLLIVILISVWLTRISAWFTRNWAAPYVKGRAELGARDDMLKTILKEVQHSTHIQEQIKSEISGRDWNRQRAYELRRDSYVDSLRTLGELARPVGAAREQRTFFGRTIVSIRELGWKA